MKYRKSTDLSTITLGSLVTENCDAQHFLYTLFNCAAEILVIYSKNYCKGSERAFRFYRPDWYFRPGSMHAHGKRNQCTTSIFRSL